ncbi:MAG TPA: hypothetical protein PK231_12420, partial [Acidocella sp.]|nr:hypothetical protein [Acidocella sp.]
MAESEALAMFLSRIEPELAQSFTPAQREAIDLHFGMRYRVRHLIDWRRRILFPFSRFYIVLLAGRE